MAAGLGFKTFATGDVLSAGDVNGYLMQGVLVFASAAARDAAITSPQEGQFAYLKDTNVTTYYTGSAWSNLDTTGMTNPMTTTGDTIYSSSGSTPARLGIGTTGQVLTVSGGVPSWAAPATGGGMTLLASGTFPGTGTNVTVSSLSTSYNDLRIYVNNYKGTSDTELYIQFNSDTATRYNSTEAIFGGGAGIGFPLTSISLYDTTDSVNNYGMYDITIPNYANTATWKTLRSWYVISDNTVNTNARFRMVQGIYNQTTAIDAITFRSGTGNISGTYSIYGVK
jgi:hypothetical protein